MALTAPLRVQLGLVPVCPGKGALHVARLPPTGNSVHQRLRLALQMLPPPTPTAHRTGCLRARYGVPNDESCLQSNR